MKSIINIQQSSSAGIFSGITESIKTNDTDNGHLVINCHSFSRYPLPGELDQQKNRPHVVIGADIDHTPDFLINVAVDLFEGVGLTVAVNPAFAGTQKSCNSDMVISLGVREDLYIDKAGRRKSDFALVKWKVKSVIDRLVILGNAGLLH